MNDLFDDEEDLFDDEEDLLDEEESILDALEDDEDTDDGVSADADEDGVSAEAGETDANAADDPGTDPDDLPPVSGPQDGVIDEIPNGTPLPPTGGRPVAALTPLAGIALAPLVVTALVLTGLSARWMRHRRSR